MSSKGDQTRKTILEEAEKLFAEKGFTNVTMKNICDQTGLSRGGLYRHYNGTDEIFEQMFRNLSAESVDWMEEQMNHSIPAPEILSEALKELEKEMCEKENSLSLAIYEYAVTRDSRLFDELNEAGRRKWERLLSYGMKREEFKKTNPEPIIDLLLYSYQGVRMWSRVITIEKKQIHAMMKKIKKMLV